MSDFEKLNIDWDKLREIGNLIKPSIEHFPIDMNPCIGIDLGIPVIDRAAETAALKAKYGENFEPDFTDSKVIGRWKTEKKPEYRRRWNGMKYVYEEIK